ncbi:hypothetical protein [Salinimicrobium catena]|uniref:hypothetical protein n=1 Tax=Salinimicrobium catena TaxID=390640 RepID=UPI00115FA14C|nr:hypothetical protein [Salinimicrobium catena]
MSSIAGNIKALPASPAAFLVSTLIVPIGIWDLKTWNFYDLENPMSSIVGNIKALPASPAAFLVFRVAHQNKFWPLLKTRKAMLSHRFYACRDDRKQ